MPKKKRTRIMWSRAQKRAIIKEYNSVPKGEKIKVLEKHGLWHSHICEWRKQLGLRRKKGPRVRRRKA
jgi:transposase-like protein